jgi:hypothetical protein
MCLTDVDVELEQGVNPFDAIGETLLNALMLLSLSGVVAVLRRLIILQQQHDNYCLQRQTAVLPWQTQSGCHHLRSHTQTRY